MATTTTTRMQRNQLSERHNLKTFISSFLSSGFSTFIRGVLTSLLVGLFVFPFVHSFILRSVMLVHLSVSPSHLRTKNYFSNSWMSLMKSNSVQYGFPSMCPSILHISVYQNSLHAEIQSGVRTHSCPIGLVFFFFSQLRF